MAEATGLMRPTVLVVDDTPDNISIMCDLLKGLYHVKVATSGEKALRIAGNGVPPDLILLDIMMPDMDGYQVCRELKRSPATRDIPIIFLTARRNIDDERRGLELGAVDYITKPISPPTVLARVQTHLNLKAASDFLKDKNTFLEREVERRSREVRAVQEATIMALASLAETRDNDTGNHLRRTQCYVKALAEKLRDHPRFAGDLTDAHIALLFKSAPLHDIGKVGIPDRILLKPGPLEPEEFEIMKRHTLIGREALESAKQALGAPVEFLRVAEEVTQSHHERWDGSGYPDRLAGDAIPVSARLMALADFYDALISWRVYRPGFPHDEVVRMIWENKGSHFDPDVVDAFMELQEQFREIALRLADHGEHGTTVAPEA